MNNGAPLDPDGRVPPGGRQKAFAVLVGAGAISYFALVTSGIIKPANRLSASEVGILLIAALSIALALRPEFLDRLQKFDFGGLKLELRDIKRDQAEVKQQQEQQAAILEDVRLALRLLIGDKERRHLMNLFRRDTSGYHIKGALRDEIRNLRTMKLVRMRPAKTVGGMPDKTTFDLADFVELTDDGRKFATRLEEQSETRASDTSAS